MPSLLPAVRAELARRLDASKVFVARLFNGSSNLTARTMVAVAGAVEGEFEAVVRRPRWALPQGLGLKLTPPADRSRR